jgi:hypothetical protein
MKSEGQSKEQPVLLPFPGYPTWQLFFCSCWVERMQDHRPQLPAHIEAAITIDRPQGGHLVTCARCKASWFFREQAQDWLKLANDVEIPMSGAERLSLYNEGLANEAMDMDSPRLDLEFKPEP